MNLNNPRRGGQPQLVIFFIVIAGILLIMDQRGMLDGVLARVRSPLIGMTGRLSDLNDPLRQPVDLEAATSEIAALRQRIEQLEQENSQLRVVESEYIRIRQALDLQNDAPNIKTVMGQVVGKGSNPAFDDLIIDVGSDDGVRVGMPVRSSRGLVGQVFQTTANAAQVVLLTDASVSVPSRLSQARALGVVRGGGSGGLLTLEFVALEAPLTVGDVVLTAGIQGETTQELIANRFPPDLVIGQVIKVERSDAALFQTAIVQPDVDFDGVETVFVITDFDVIDTTLFGGGQP
ncbi:MAG TPA: rod shape-determining protein MreC [Anaerolineae bacterium]|nr:rod shape-determining protein MreC [Anaerolineae bacterium]